MALIGGGDVSATVTERLLALAGPVVGADGGADWLLRRGRMPDAVIGDMDSLSAARMRRLPEERLFRISEQDSTDFEKCLSRIEAPLVLGTGFLGARVDHMLAAFTVLSRYAHRPCLLAGPEDVVFLCPPDLTLTRPRGERLSLFPMGAVQGRSEGLEWPIEGIDFAPDGRVGTSNRVSGALRLRMNAPKMLVIMPVAALEEAVSQLLDCAARWPAPAR